MHVLKFASLPIILLCGSFAQAQQVEYRLTLHQGENTAAIPVITNRTIPDLLWPLVEQGVLERVADDEGRFFIPAQNFNNIPIHNPVKGYSIRVTADAELVVQGRRLPSDYRFRLHRGENLVVYFPEEDLNMRRNLGWIPREVIAIRDGAGNFCIPSRRYSNLNPVSSGDFLRVTTAQTTFMRWPKYDGLRRE